MVVPQDWIPDNNLGAGGSLPIGAVWPSVDMDRGGHRSDGALSEVDDVVNAGLHAWVAYGAMAVAHWAYYSDRFYYTYTNSEFHTAGL
jgi:hypothetical protein